MAWSKQTMHPMLKWHRPLDKEDYCDNADGQPEAHTPSLQSWQVAESVWVLMLCVLRVSLEFERM